MRIRSVIFDELEKRFRLQNDRRITTHRYSCLGPGDNVIVRDKSHLQAICSNGRATILPAYTSRDTLQLGPRKLPLTIKEIETGEELAGYHKLEEYHYRGKILHGRRVPLIVKASDPLLPSVLGYVELATAFIMSRPRATVLDAPFTHPKGKISWSEWKKDAARKYTNLVVRIARTVVSPEFRGLGIAGILVKHAAKFARAHWNVGRLKPLFLEITADMLRYVPFVESAGMHYIGETEGNLDRVNKDMSYILKNYARVKRREILKEESAGIVDLQVFYATQLRKIQKETGVAQENLLSLLLKSPERLSDENWSMLHRIFRLPKPSFLLGLDHSAEGFVRRRIEALGLPQRYPSRSPAQVRVGLSEPIEVENCSVKLNARLLRTKSSRRIQQAFGVSREMLSTTLFSNLGFKIRPGDVVLICGPSGAGKTTLLSLLSQKLTGVKDKTRTVTGTIRVPSNVEVAPLSKLDDSRPLINALGRVPFEHALHALNVSGLAEAHLYVKRFSELSNGQRYRAMVAKLIASGRGVWIADEFCATLDPVTANIVSRNLRRCAKLLGVTAILAAANWTEFIQELRPDVVIQLRAPWDHEVFTWKSFNRALARSQLTGGPRVQEPLR